MLHPRGFYMVADRGDDQVGVYRIDGTVVRRRSPQCRISVPRGRDSAPLPWRSRWTANLLIAANALTRNLTVFQVNSVTGGLTSLGVQPPNTLGTTGFDYRAWRLFRHRRWVTSTPTAPPTCSGATR